MEEFTNEVKKIEEQAEKILEDAEKKKAEIIAKAKTDSISLITKKQKELEKKKDADVDRQKVKIDAKKREMFKQGEKEIMQVEKTARQRIPKAVDFVLERLEEKISE